MKSVEEFLSDLNELDIKLYIDGNLLRCNAPKGKLTPDLRAHIAERKPEILTFLHKANIGGYFNNNNQSIPQIVPNPNERYKPFPLTDTQHAYWIGRNSNFELSNVSTHVYIETDFVDLDVECFEKAWQRLINRHDMLRVIVQPDGQQRILEQVPPYKIKMLDLQRQNSEIAASLLTEIRERMSHQVLPTDQWPLFEIQACQLNENKVRFHWSFDLLVIDAWSFTIIFRELAELIQNPEICLPNLELSFRDYVLTEVNFRDSQLYHRSKNYWQNHITTLSPSPELPLQKSLKAVKSPRFVRQTGKLDADTWHHLKIRAEKANLTPSGILLAAFAEILTIWSRSPQFTINLTVFNRLPLHPEVNNIVGDFTSVTLLGVDNSEQNSFEVRARRIQKQLWDDFDHRYFSGVQVLRELARIQEQPSGALMPVVFTSTLINESLTRGTPSEKPLSILSLGEVVYAITQTSQVYLDHQVYEEAGDLVFHWDYVEELFPTGLLDDMLAAYCNFLENLANSNKLWQATTRQLLSPAKLKQIAAINATEAPVPEAALLHTLFFEQVLLHPLQAAVVTSHRTLTYQELSDRANQLGHQLRQLGVRPNQLVAIVMEKGWEQVVATLGILASGAAYVPIDPELPTERQWHLLQQAEVQWVLTQSHLDTSLEWPENTLRLCVDVLESSSTFDPLESVQQPLDLAYVIYTSGSTGLPKGVMIDHRGAVNTILDINQRFNVKSEARVIALSSLSFDLSVYDIFGTLAAGGTLVIPDASATKDPAHWAQLMMEHQITIWNSVPALMQMLVEYATGRSEMLPKSLRLVMLSGDWLPLTLPDQIRILFENVQIVSLGGATEASIWSIFYPIDTVDPAWKSIPYGRPMTNQHFYVLNEALEPCPVWVPGRLYIGGIGLAKGYWRDDLKTQSSFIIHPRTKERLYKTGDLGRYLPDGNIEFLGREDFQVKINGYRIELGEIEAALEQHSLVNHAVVTAVGETRENKQLIAYIVSNSHKQLDPAKQTAEAYGPSQPEGVLTDPVKRLEFKLKQPGLRSPEPDRLSVQLIKPELDEALTQTYVKRQSYRQFLDTPISFVQFSELLNCLLQIKLNGSSLPKYRYPSAGSLYPVQTYLYVKAGRVEEMEAGIYYYHPADHRLVLLSPGSEIERRIYGEINQPIFDESAFSLFLIGQLSAITPMYGELARDFCLLEAGYISQLLMSVAPASQIGLCPVGSLDFAAIQDFFGLDSNHILLHSFLGGRIDPEKTEQALQPKATPLAATITDELRSFLQGKLPDYMVPVIYVPLDTLPLTANGKVDRRALPKPQLVQSKPDVVNVLPQTEVERTLASMVQAVLQVETLGIHSNFFELGASSLQIIELMALVRETLKIELPLTSFFEKPTIGKLAEAIDIALQEEASTAATATTTIDLNAEAILDPAIHPSNLPFGQFTKPDHIFLTGATGFLGTHLLYELLQQTQADIYCLVRASNLEEGKKRLQSQIQSYSLWNEALSSRIIPVLGDLSKPCLGLSDEQFQVMAKSIDVIYHNGALVNFLYPYSALKATNVLGTQEVLRLASQFKVKFVHFISTTTVFSSGNNSEFKVVKEQDSIDHGAVLYNGYTQSKWVAEKLVTLARERDLPVCIYRPGIITGHSETGVCSTKDSLSIMIKGCIQLGIVPDWDTMIEMVPVDYVSRGIVHLSKQEASLGKVFHLVNPHSFHWNQLTSLIHSLGYSLEQVSFDQWMLRITNTPEQFLESSFRVLMPLLQASQDRGADSGWLRFDCQNTLDGLANTDIVCPQVNYELLRTQFSYFIRNGFLEAPEGFANLN